MAKKFVTIPPCPPTPFDLEPDEFDGRPTYSVREMEERRELRARYDAVRNWHTVRDMLIECGFYVIIDENY